MAITKENVKNLSIDNIIEDCKANNRIEWLKAKAAEMVDCEVYPKVNGKADKTQAPKIEKRKITFIQIKTDYLEAFYPALAEKKAKKPTMYDKIAAL